VHAQAVCVECARITLGSVDGLAALYEPDAAKAVVDHKHWTYTMTERFQNKRVLLTDAAAFMGPAVSELMREEGAHVLADRRDLTKPNGVESLVLEAGHVDVLIANLAAPYTMAYAHEATESDFNDMFERLVLPLHRLVRTVLPQMIERRQGKIVVVGSALALRGTPMRANYAAARGAQLAYVKTVALEAIRHNVHVNAAALAFVENPTYYSADYRNTEDFERRMRDVPIGRLATGREAASLVLYLASPESDFIVGQVIPYSGGFIT
jgi:2-keto-3-deoxy-L-fuconate dehydrogenase